jgi:hypothetical protein
MLSALAYVPMALAFGEMNWKQWGPFAFQTSRIFNYAVYFAAGVVTVGGETTHKFIYRVDARHVSVT